MLTLLQPLDISATSGHAMKFYTSLYAGSLEYDPAEDGPEVDVIRSVRAKHPLYTPGEESRVLRFYQFADRVARRMYGKRYGRLGRRRQQEVRAVVVSLHVGDNFNGAARYRSERLIA